MLRIIFDFAAKIANERNLDNVLMLMADMGRDMIVADRCTVWLLDKNTNELWSKVAHCMNETRIPGTAGLVGHAVTSGTAVFIDDAYENEEYKEFLINGALKVDKQIGYRTMKSGMEKGTPAESKARKFTFTAASPPSLTYLTRDAYSDVNLAEKSEYTL